MSKFMIRFSFVSVFFFFFIVFSVSAESHHSKPIIVLTVPKSGSHLLWKIVELITDKSSWISDRRGIDEQLLDEASSSENSLIRAHILRSSVSLLRNDLDEYIKVLMIRDPRDVLLSQIDWIERSSGWFRMPIERVEKFKKMSFNEKLKEVILLSEEDHGINYFMKISLDWMKNPSVFVCRFEDLVGTSGGGSKDLQMRTIENLAKHLGIPLSRERIEEISDTIFGKSVTFRRGQIGDWRNLFSAENKDLFKKVMGDLLIDLQYEKNYAW